MGTEDNMAETNKILQMLQVSASQSDFATYCEFYDIAENLGVSQGAITRAYKEGIKKVQIELPFFRQNCSLKIEGEYKPAKERGTTTLAELTAILNATAGAAYSGDARGYRLMVTRAKFAGATNDQLRDAYEYGRRKLGATWFGWDGTRIATDRT